MLTTGIARRLAVQLYQIGQHKFVGLFGSSNRLKKSVSASLATLTDSLVFAFNSETPFDFREHRSSRSQGSLQSSWASRSRVASNAKIGLPSNSRVNTRE